MLEAIQHAPLVVSVSACLDWKYYKSGIFNLNCRVHKFDHAVLIVGYGVDAKTNQKYWIVRNSWGKDWGMNGYIHLPRDTQNQFKYGINFIAFSASYFKDTKVLGKFDDTKITSGHFRFYRFNIILLNYKSFDDFFLFLIEYLH